MELRFFFFGGVRECLPWLTFFPSLGIKIFLFTEGPGLGDPWSPSGPACVPTSWPHWQRACPQQGPSLMRGLLYIWTKQVMMCQCAERELFGVGAPQEEASKLKMRIPLWGMGGRRRAPVAPKGLHIRMVWFCWAMPVLCQLLGLLSLRSPMWRVPLFREKVSEANKPSSVPWWLCDHHELLSFLHLIFFIC